MSLRIIRGRGTVGEEPDDATRFTDRNQVKWRINVQGGAWVAFVDSDSPFGYLNVFQTVDDGARTNGDGKPFKIFQWVVNEDMPSLAGKLSDLAPRSAIESFAQTNKGAIRIRSDVPVSVQVKRDQGSMVGILVVLAIVAAAWYSDKPKRGRR